jgi:3D (Asp-Asp-Asp) domain-containing protein
VALEGLGEFKFKDLMPPRWKHYRVDIWFKSVKECHAFGVQRKKIWVVSLP